MGEEYESTTGNVTDSSGHNELLEGPVDIGRRGFRWSRRRDGPPQDRRRPVHFLRIHKSSGMCHIGQGSGVKLPTREKEATHG